MRMVELYPLRVYSWVIVKVGRGKKICPCPPCQSPPCICLSLCLHKMIADVIFLFVFGQVGQVWLVLEGSKSSRQNRYRGARAAKNDF